MPPFYRQKFCVLHWADEDSSSLCENGDLIIKMYYALIKYTYLGLVIGTCSIRHSGFRLHYKNIQLS